MKMYLAGILMGVLIAVRIAWWMKFRQEARGRRVGIGTLQLLLVLAWAITDQIKPQWMMGRSAAV